MEATFPFKQDHTSICVDLKKCIICQNSEDIELSSTSNGILKIKEAAEVRQDNVFAHIKLLEPNDIFKYHMDNKCYKTYTLKKSLDNLQVIYLIPSIHYYISIYLFSYLFSHMACKENASIL